MQITLIFLANLVLKTALSNALCKEKIFNLINNKDLYDKCLKKQNEIVDKYYNKNYLKNYLINIIKS